jgi:hypothetical protein
LAHNQQELQEAEAALAVGSEAELQAEVVWYLAVLRKNVQRIEKMLNEPKKD